jgi:hypothetical protein
MSIREQWALIVIAVVLVTVAVYYGLRHLYRLLYGRDPW